jgi:hypothetical protein
MNYEEDMQRGEIVLYIGDEGAATIEVLFKDETMWLSLNQISNLFQRDKSVISRHIKNVFDSGELDQDSVVAFFATTAADGKNYDVNYYNLDVIISVGYRVNSKEATQFRIWATNTLKEYITKGFVLDDELLKNGTRFGKDYFDELLERIKEIRASERRFYQKIMDLYKDCSYDYNENAEITRNFYAMVQNKLHYAITGHTAAEIKYLRADSNKEHMGLETWKGSPDGKILQSDTMSAKNYLSEAELKELNNIVTMFLDYAENIVSKHQPMSMEDWVKRLDAFLKFNEYELLENAGEISAKLANAIVDEEYKKFRIVQDANYESDFDKSIKKYLKNT